MTVPIRNCIYPQLLKNLENVINVRENHKTKASQIFGKKAIILQAPESWSKLLNIQIWGYPHYSMNNRVRYAHSEEKIFK